MKRLITIALLVASTLPLRAQGLDLHTVAMPNSPPVADWIETVRITRVDMDPRGGVALTFDRPIPDRWKVFTNPLVPDENFQFTVWACVEHVYCAGFIQMWQGRSMTDGSLPPILSTGAANWWGDVRHLWDAMSDYRPQPGDEVGFLITAGNGRLTSGVSSVRERSQVALVRLPAGDSGHFVIDGAEPPAIVTPPPAPPPTVVVVPPPLDLSSVTAQLRDLNAKLDELARANGDAHASINQNVTDGRAENTSRWAIIVDHWKPIAMVTAPFVTWYVTKRTVQP